MVMKAPDPLTFVLGGRDRLRWHWYYAWRTQAGRYLAAALMMVGPTGNLVLHPVHDATAVTIVRYGYVVTVLLAIGWAIATLRARKRTERLSLTFGDKDIDLSCDCKVERISWYGIRGAFAFEEFYAIERRADSRRPILVPRAALSDAEAFWSYLELRLQGTRPASRDLGVAAPKRLTNRTGQYLIEHLTGEAQ
jgi:hypothetical protein